MKYFLSALFLMSFLIQCYGQDEMLKYPSKEEKAYYKSRNFESFHPASVTMIKNLHYDFLSIRKSEVKTNPFTGTWDNSPYQDSISMIDNYEKLMENYKLPGDSIGGKVFKERMDSILQLTVFNSKISEISKDEVLRYDSIGTKHIIMYHDFYLEDDQMGYWIAISNDNGEKWNKYYTGLVANNFYHIKPKPSVKLFKNDSIIQLEIAIVRQMTPSTKPVGFPKYELVEDDLIMELNLNRIISDKDSDGLSDLFEKKISTNPLLKDTDSDGIEDSTDCNPRYPNIKNKYSNLYKYLLEFGGDDTISFANFEFKSPHGEMINKGHVYVIVTDDKNVINLTNTNNKYIFMTSEEYEGYIKENLVSPERLIVSPMFKVDNKLGYYKIQIDWNMWGVTYLIIEKENEWIVKMIDSYII
jgi:hypothetical protein